MRGRNNTAYDFCEVLAVGLPGEGGQTRGRKMRTESRI
jgi:hypothetical protein